MSRSLSRSLPSLGSFIFVSLLITAAWLARFAEMGPEKAARWSAWWDPASWLPRAEMPMLWVRRSRGRGRAIN